MVVCGSDGGGGLEGISYLYYLDKPPLLIGLQLNQEVLVLNLDLFAPNLLGI